MVAIYTSDETSAPIMRCLKKATINQSEESASDHDNSDVDSDDDLAAAITRCNLREVELITAY